MSLTSDETPSALARAARGFAKTFADQLRVRPRGTDPVRRATYDIDDDIARVHEPLGDGTVEDAVDSLAALRAAAHRFHRETKAEKRYSQGDLTRADLALLDALTAKDVYDLYSGTNDLAISQLSVRAGTGESTVKESKKRLARFCGLDWVRRSCRTGLAKAFGVPNAIQVSCLYSFSVSRMCERFATMFQNELRGLRERRATRERVAKTEGQRRRLTMRVRRPQATAARLNPVGWAAALKAAAKAKVTSAQRYAAEEARALAYATELALHLHAKPE